MNTITSTRRGLALAAALLTACGSAVAQTPAPAPQPTSAPTRSYTSTSSSWTVSKSDDGRTVTVRGKDGDITAEIDGRAVPADRIQRTPSGVTITDERGDVVFDQPVPDMDVTTIDLGPGGSTRIYTPGRPSRARALLFGPQGQSGINVAPQAPVAGQPAEEPRVMIGVQLADPDASIRGHFGLKADEATLVAAVYDGLPAQLAGLEPYDVIVGINGQPTASPAELRRVLRDTDPGASFRLDVLHKGERKTVTLTPERYDREKIQKARVNAIAALEQDTLGVSPLAAIAGAPQGWSSRPFVGVYSGPNGQARSQVFSSIDADRAAAMAEKEMEQAVKRLNENMDRLHGPDGLNQRLEERMRQLEAQLQRMMERNGPGVPTPVPPPAPAAPGAPASPEKTGSQS